MRSTVVRGIVAGALLVAAQPYAAHAKSLCITNNLSNAIVVLTNPKIRPGRSYPVSGYKIASITGASGMIGTSIVNTARTKVALALESTTVSVTESGSYFGPGPGPVFNMIFSGANASLEVGSISVDGSIGSFNATFTVIDCAGVAPIP